jgi:hypothetical protein
MNWRSISHKPWFNKECSELLHQRQHAKLQRLQEPSEINGATLNNVRIKPLGISGIKEGYI